MKINATMMNWSAVLNPLFLSFLFICLSLVNPSQAVAQSEYITDDFEVMLRTGPSIQNKIVRPLRSGTQIEVLREDSGNGHSQVQTYNGEIGYVLRRFITTQSPAKNRLRVLEQQLAQLRSEPNEIRALLAKSQDENQQLIAQNLRLTEASNKAQEDLQAFMAISGNVIELSAKNTKLESEVHQLLLQLDDIRIQNEALKDTSDTVRNLVGVGILLLGLLLGWILSISGRRNRNSWGS